MILSQIYARFFKSFNFDHHRKAHSEAKPREWEMIGSLWYPYIEVPIDGRMTTVVGANESGKSHLLDAVRKAISGEGFRHQDLCRYCEFFNVERGNEFWPHLGVAWSEVDEDEVSLIRAQAPDAPVKFTSFLMFREGPHILDLYFPDGVGDFQRIRLEDDAAQTFGKEYLPRDFTIDSKAALPAALPTSEFVEGGNGAQKNPKSRKIWIAAADTLISQWTGNSERFASALPQIAAPLAKIISDAQEVGVSAEELQRSYKLARKLLLKLANIEPQRLTELAKYIEAGENGHANALAESINQQLEKKLNFPKYWVQDRDFQLRVTALESELVFTIRDRTGTEYTFDERSAGLKFFLSYFIQAQTHVPDPNRREILLMDEPDAYLSAEAQQDLLKIFKNFAEPDGDRRPVQVIYVTHSPFLLDKNHAERIRVLQKGKGEDGTRVIKQASQNHYEPLRSAFGAYVGETAFIGACNLLVEGAADQVLLAGVSRAIQRRGFKSESELLDLNQVVMVPCGSANHVPYMLYLIRGRDSDSPSVVILLDSDSSGDQAAEVLRKDDKQSRRLINPDYVLQFGELNIGEDAGHLVAEPEDLMPVELAVEAANHYFREVAEFRSGAPIELGIQDVRARLSASTGIFDALKAAAEAQQSHIDKLGLARAVVAQCEAAPGNTALEKAVGIFLERMRDLFRGINKKVRSANEEKRRHRVKAAVDQHRKIFVQDHPDGATREQAQFLFEKIEEGLDGSLDGKAIRDRMRELSNKFSLDDEPNEPIQRYDEFLLQLRVLRDSFQTSKNPTQRGASQRQIKRPKAKQVRTPAARSAKDAAKKPKKKSRATGVTKNDEAPGEASQ